MLKLPRKLRIFRAKSRISNPEIVKYTGASLQSVVNWASEDRCPKKIDIKFAESLQRMSNGYITLRDCGHE